MAPFCGTTKCTTVCIEHTIQSQNEVINLSITPQSNKYEIHISCMLVSPNKNVDRVIYHNSREKKKHFKCVRFKTMPTISQKGGRKFSWTLVALIFFIHTADSRSFAHRAIRCYYYRSFLILHFCTGNFGY